MSVPQNIQDKELLLRIAAGDEQAFRVLFDQHWKPLFRAAMTLVKVEAIANDLLQEIFLKLWDIRAQLPEKENIRNFIGVVARNHIKNELRKKSHEAGFNEQLLRHFADTSPDALEQLIKKESGSLLEQAIRQLPEQQRQVYRLTRECGLSQQEIATQLNISKSTIKTHMSRALSSIRDYIIQHASAELLIVLLVQETFQKIVGTV